MTENREKYIRLTFKKDNVKMYENSPKCDDKTHVSSALLGAFTFFLSLMEPFPRTIILQPVSASSCLAVSPRGPKILPTKLNCAKGRNTQI